jgi:outer membrane lipoprotein-sorting protein
MRRSLWVVILLCLPLLASAQTAEELVAKNIATKGGMDKIKAIHSLKMTGRYQDADGFQADVSREWKAPNDIRNMFSLQGMTQIQAYDGATGWQINPFEGRRDPEMLGEDDLRDISEDADFYGPLVDAAEKGNKIEYVGHATIDGDDALKLKVTLKNGDIIDYYLDPDTFLEFRTERQEFIRGSMNLTVTELGSYKQVDGVYYPFSMTTSNRRDMRNSSTVTISKIEANVPFEDAAFKMPAAPAVPSPQKHEEPPAKGKGKPPAANKTPAGNKPPDSSKPPA